MNYAIIAAGEGSRMREGAGGIPKPLVPLYGVPMIGRLIDILDRARAERIDVIVNEQSPQVASYLGSLTPRSPLRVITKTTRGSFESFCELARHCDPDAPLCLLTVDTIFSPEEFGQYVAQFEADPEADGYMAVTDYICDEKPLYVAATPDGEIAGFLDNPSEGVDLVSGGIYLLRPSALELIDDCLLAGKHRMRDFQRTLVAAGLRLKAWKFSRIIDADTPADLEEARRYLETQP